MRKQSSPLGLFVAEKWVKDLVNNSFAVHGINLDPIGFYLAGKRIVKVEGRTGGGVDRTAGKTADYCVGIGKFIG